MSVFDDKQIEFEKLFMRMLEEPKFPKKEKDKTLDFALLDVRKYSDELRQRKEKEIADFNFRQKNFRLIEEFAKDVSTIASTITNFLFPKIPVIEIPRRPAESDLTLSHVVHRLISACSSGIEEDLVECFQVAVESKEIKTTRKLLQIHHEVLLKFNPKLAYHKIIELGLKKDQL